MTDLPVVCALSPAALAARRQGLLRELMSIADAPEVLPDGYRLSFAGAGETLSLITRAVEAERQCCCFLRFHIIVEPDSGPIVLELTGPSGTREFLSALFEP